MISTQEFLSIEKNKDYFKKLFEFLECEYRHHRVFPKKEDIFKALELTPLESTKVVILGQDPYHGEGQAEGLSFSVSLDVKNIPPSLKNIWKELNVETSMDIPRIGSLKNIAKRGVLFLNTILTVREGEPNSHKGIGWEIFTDEIIRTLSNSEREVIFVLWGNEAKSKIKLIDANKNTIFASSHPSPLGARHSFFGSNVFNKINDRLNYIGEKSINFSPYNFITLNSKIINTRFFSDMGIKFDSIIDKLILSGFEVFIDDVSISNISLNSYLEKIDSRYGISVCVDDEDLLKARSYSMKSVLLRTDILCMIKADRYILKLEEILNEIGAKL